MTDYVAERWICRDCGEHAHKCACEPDFYDRVRAELTHLRAQLAARDATIAQLREALRPFARLYEPEKDEDCGITHYDGAPIDAVRTAARIYAAIGAGEVKP